MTIYHVGIEASSPGDLSGDERSAAVSRLVDAFSQLPLALGAVVSWGGMFAGPGVQEDVEAGSPGDAVRLALELFEEAASRAGLGEVQPVRVDLMTEEAFVRWLEQPPPELVGVSEIATLLGVSKQRVSELRQRDDFPTPVAELAAGPVWKRSSLQRFIDTWPRRTGRPPMIETLPMRGVRISGSPTEPTLDRFEKIVRGLEDVPGSVAVHAEMLDISPETVRGVVERVKRSLRERERFHVFVSHEAGQAEFEQAIADEGAEADVHVR